MGKTVLRRVLDGLGANVYGQCVTVAVQLVGVPILLHFWGAQLYGEWLLLFALPEYLAMSQFGFSHSAANDMTARVSCGDYQTALKTFQSLTLAILVVTAMAAAIGAIVLQTLPVHEWLNFHAMDSETARWVLLLLGCAVLLRLFDGVVHAGFRASGDYAFHVGLSSSVRLLQYVGIWISTFAGAGPTVAAGTFCLIRLLSTPVTCGLLVRRHPWLRFGTAHARASELRRLFNPALANSALSMSRLLSIQGMVLAVGAVLGPSAVVVFSTLRTLSRLVLQLVASVGHAAEPELAVAWGVRNQALMRSLFVHVLRGGFWVAIAAGGVLLAFGSHILEVWTNGKVEMNISLFTWLLASACASALWYGALVVLKAANRHVRAAFVLTAASATGVALAAVLLSRTGNLASAGVALLFGDAFIALYTTTSAAHLIGATVLPTLLNALNPHQLVLLIQRARIR